MTPTAITIHKSHIGLLGLFLAGFIVIGILLAGTAFELMNNHNQRVEVLLPVVGIVLVLLITFVAAYIYSLSTVVLSAESFTFTSWPSLFFSNVAVAEWRQVQDVDVKKGNVLSQLFDYGTLLVQTAGTERNLRIPMIPHVEQWRDYIAQQADVGLRPSKKLPNVPVPFP